MGSGTSMEKLAGMSMEELDALESGVTPVDGDNDTTDTDSEAEVEQAVAGEESASAPAGVTEKAPEQTGKLSDKELNFAKLRTKTERLESEVEALRRDNERLNAARPYQSDVPENHAEQAIAVQAGLDGLKTKLEEGEISVDEYLEQQSQLLQRRVALLKAETKAEVSAEMREQAKASAEATDKANWEKSCETFMGKPVDGIDYKTDSDKAADLNALVIALGSDPRNADKPNDWFLTTAHAMVRAKNGIADQPAAKPDRTAAEIPQAAPSVPFHTLSDIPGGALPANSEGEQLTEMSGAALTNRFRNMTNQQIDAELAKLG